MGNTRSSVGNVAVLGAGSWGTALALLLAEGGAARTEVRLWDRTPAVAQAIAADRENRHYLPGFPLPPHITVTADIAEAVRDVACVVLAVPSGAVRSVATLAAPHLLSGCDIVLASKGLEPETGLLPYQVAEELLGPDFPLVALSGPNLASEIARGIPAAAVSACPDPDAAERVSRLFHRNAFRVYTSDDRTGVEIGGAVKNVLAIAGGVSDGLGFGDNTKAALLTRGLTEMARFGVAMGARRDTFYGLTGVGDLMATAASRLSRNWRVGEGLAKGESLPAILERLGQVAEGVSTAQVVTRIAAQKGIEMPVCEAVAHLLAGETSPREAVDDLMSRHTSRED
ncbi:MAG: NAD(P)H-dependent glycerol-3-phosphate dehydrogenase [Armatimonadota bacterium]